MKGTFRMESNWGILGHEWAVDMLKQHLLHGQVRHAYLLTGPSGLGRRTLALRFAQALNCPTPLQPGEPCRECKTCRQIEAMTYPDLTVVQSEAVGGVLKVEQIRQVQHSLSLKPFKGAHRVALFLRFQEANANAQNALLKTLEEAPAYVILMLTADGAEQLFPTIVSRCEVLRLRPLPAERVESFLTARGVDPSAARLLAAVSGGRPGYARTLRDEPQALEFRRVRLEDLPRLLGGTRQERFAYAELLARDKESFRATLLIWLAYWRDVLLRTAGSGGEMVNVDRAEEIAERAATMTLAEAHRLVAGLEAALEQLEKNANPRLLAEVLLLDWPHG